MSKKGLSLDEKKIKSEQHRLGLSLASLASFMSKHSNTKDIDRGLLLPIVVLEIFHETVSSERPFNT